jgi:trans-aconitate methyltransferase
MSIINYIKNNISDNISNVLELGSGDQSDALQILQIFKKVKYFAIDRKNSEIKNSNISFINFDYFNINSIDKIIKNEQFNIVFSNYSLCFNKKDLIIELLPYYFKKIVPGGIFYLSDFTKNEQTVIKRTNLDDEWFFELINKYFKSYTILSKKTVYEKEHDHSHSIFDLIAYK